jgi:hypothetical protein
MRSLLVIRITADQDKTTGGLPVEAGHMNELVELAAKAGVENAIAGKTIGIILGFLRNEGPADRVQALFDTIAGAKTVMEAPSGGGLVVMGGGLMALGSKFKLMRLGLSMSRIQGVARELFKFGRDTIGADQMGEIMAGTPRLRQFA